MFYILNFLGNFVAAASFPFAIWTVNVIIGNLALYLVEVHNTPVCPGLSFEKAKNTFSNTINLKAEAPYWIMYQLWKTVD